MSDKASEFITLMTAAKELINDAGQQANAAAGTADEGAELFAQGGNANSHAMMTAAAETARKVFSQAAGLISLADEAITQAQQAKGDLHGSASGSLSPPPFRFEVVAAPRDASPRANQEPISKVGDPVQPPQGGPDDVASFRLELTPNDDQDESKARMNRFGRAAIRRTEDVQAQTKDTTASLIGQIEARDTVETVGVPPEHGHPEKREPEAGVSVPDALSNAVLYTVFAVEGLSRLGNTRKAD